MAATHLSRGLPDAVARGERPADGVIEVGIDPPRDRIRHTFGDLAPISASSAQRALDSGGTMTKDVPLACLGFGPAPAYVEKSSIQNRIA